MNIFYILRKDVKSISNEIEWKLNGNKICNYYKIDFIHQ